MNEKIKKVGITAKEKVTEFAKKNPVLTAAVICAGGMIITYTLGVKEGYYEAGFILGNALGIYPKDATVGQFIEDLGKARG